MKAQHRHQLQTNVLADRMGRLIQGMKSGRKSSSGLVWGFVLLAVVTIVGWQIYSRSLRAETSARWVNLDAVTHNPSISPEDLENFAQANPGTIAGRSARVQAARLALQEGQAG